MSKNFRSKISMSLVSLLMLSLLLPVLSYAAAVYVGFFYDEEEGTLSGYVYTNDPDAVNISVYDETGAQSIVDVDNKTFQYNKEDGFDNNNVQYYTVGYSVYLGDRIPNQLKINDGEILNKNERGNFHYEDTTVALNVYRMQGTQHYSGLLGDSYLSSGQQLVTFKPEEDGHNAIDLFLPTDYDEQQALFNPNVTAETDFQLVDTTVSQSVYPSKVNAGSSFDYTTSPRTIVDDYNSLLLQFAEPLLAGHTYELKLSETSGGNEIQLPSAGDHYSASVRYGDFKSFTSGGQIYKYVSGENIALFDNVTIASESSSNSGNENNENPITPAATVPAAAADNSGKQVVNSESLKSGKDGIVTVQIKADKPQVLLPIKAAEAVGNNKLQLDSDGLTVEIPTKVLAKLQALLPADQLEGAQIAFDFKNVSGTAASDLLSKANMQSMADVKAAGDIYDFTLSVVKKDGKTTVLSQFEEPITISLKVAANSNKSLLGVYYIADDGKLEYVGGKLVGDEIKVDVHHFSKYAVLEYNKSFKDVAADYWAAAIIKEMAAKHIVQGVSADMFAPQADVTRAEFAALLVRALGLKANGPASFADVSADAWYAEAVAAASQAGIVQGKDAATFAPNAKITREEMSALLVRAYEHKAGSKLAGGAEAQFADRSEAADWALAYIDAANAAGFIKGRNDNEFAPKAQLTRAESAQAIYTLLLK